jgi:HEPN domain-containing protein/predicted nucleotidyltransferase
MASIEDLIAMKAEGKVVFALTRDFSGWVNLPRSYSDIKRVTGLSDPALAKALRRLLRAGVIERVRREYRIREKHREELLATLQPFYSDFLLRKAREVAKGLARTPEVVSVFLLGSAAEGKATPYSDLDLLVILKHRDDRLEKELSKAASELSTRLGVSIEPSFLSVKGASGLGYPGTLSGVPVFDRSRGQLQRMRGRRVTTGRISVFLETAGRHLRDAKSALERGVFHDAVYHSASATENAADAFILWLGGAVPHVRGDAEAIEHLARRVRPGLLKNGEFGRVVEKIRELQRHVVKSKYPVEVKSGIFLPPQEFYTKNKARELFREARWIVQATKDFLTTR